jgi:hypothetical protein
MVRLLGVVEMIETQQLIDCLTCQWNKTHSIHDFLPFGAKRAIGSKGQDIVVRDPPYYDSPEPMNRIIHHASTPLLSTNLSSIQFSTIMSDFPLDDCFSGKAAAFVQYRPPNSLRSNLDRSSHAFLSIGRSTYPSSMDPDRGCGTCSAPSGQALEDQHLHLLLCG